MAATMLDELLRLKIHREDKAEMNLSKCRLALAEVNRRTDEARAGLTEYQKWSQEHESGLFGAMYGQRVRVRDLERVREDVLILRLKERSLAEQLAKVEDERQQADVAVSSARGAHEQATRNREKFVQLVAAQAEEIRLEGERKEDLELEETHAALQDRAEWEVSDDE